MSEPMLSDEQLAEWEALIEKLNVDEYNQAVPKNAPWRAQPGPCHNWTVYQPIAPSGDYRVIADELREPFATFIAAARSAVPALVRALRDARDEVRNHELCNGGCVPGDAYRDLAHHHAEAERENAALRERLAAVETLCDASDEADLRPAHPDFIDYPTDEDRRAADAMHGRIIPVVAPGESVTIAIPDSGEQHA